MHHVVQKLLKNNMRKTTFLDGEFVVWRPISWDKYKAFRELFTAARSTGREVYVEELIYDEGLVESSFEIPPPIGLLTPDEQMLWKIEQRERTPAGVITTVAKLISRASGSTSLERVQRALLKGEQEAARVESQLVSFVCQAFPAYKPEDVESMDWETLMKRIGQASMILGRRMELQEAKN